MRNKRAGKAVAALAMGIVVAAGLVAVGAKESGPSLTYHELLVLAGDKTQAASAKQDLEAASGLPEAIGEEAVAVSKLKEELTELNSNLTKTNTVLENRKPIIVDSTAQGTVNLDTNSFLKAGITYAFIVTVSSNISSESYKQEINCALNNVNM